MPVPESERQRRIAFEFLVVQMLWAILRAVTCAKPSWPLAGDARVNALNYFDQYGNQAEGAPKYRREVSFPDLPWTSR